MPDPIPTTLAPELGEVWIPRSKRRLFVIAALCVAMGALSGFVAVSDSTTSNRVVGGVGVAFFGGGGLYLLWQTLVSRQTGLRLNREGFTIVAGRRTTLYRWDDIQRFQIVRIGNFNQLAGFELNDEARRTGLMKAGRAMSGVDGMLPNPLVVKPTLLVAVMSAWWTRYARHVR